MATDGKTCLPYYLVAYPADGESPPSNVAQFCPERKPLKAVRTVARNIWIITQDITK